VIISGVPAAFRPPAFASWTILFPLGSWAFLTVGLPDAHSAGTPAGVATFHTCETRPGWTPSSSRDGGALPLGARPLTAPATSQRPVLYPATASHPARLAVTRLHRGFTHVRPSGLLLVCGARMEREPLDLPPDASHPAVTRDARQGRSQALSTGLELHLRHRRTSNRCVHSQRATSCRTGGSAPPGLFGSRCAYPHPRKPGCPTRRGPRHVRFPRSLRFDQRAWRPALPLRPRHGYAIDLHRDLPDL